MKISFFLRHEAWELTLMLFVAMLLLAVIGRYVGSKLFAERDKDGSVLGSLFAIMGLMLAFTFGMALTRYEKRIDIIIQESNDIGTAILRADLYPEEYRQQFRADFKQYVEARIAYFEAGADTGKILAAMRQTDVIAQRIWNRAAELSTNPAITTPATMQMIPALNAMIDIGNTRWRMALARVPESILYLLLALICICAFHLGYALSNKKTMDWLGIFGVALLVCSVIFLVIDIDRPRRGTITLEETNRAIVDLRKMFE